MKTTWEQQPQQRISLHSQPREEPYAFFETLVKARAKAELRCAQDHLQKCIENKDYRGAAGAKENIDALTVVVARADSNISRTMTAQRVVYQGPQAKRATHCQRPFCIFASKKNVT